jgi:hypothetical protein
MWDGNVIANHNVIIDTADGRQGSPLLPTAILTAAKTLAAGGDLNLGSDCFANFVGFDAKIPGGGGAVYPSSFAGGNILLVDPSGKFAVASYTGNTGAKLTGLADVGINQSSKESTLVGDWAVGTMVYQANSEGTPIGYALAMGKSALYYAKGSVFNEQIFHYDDFSNSGNESHLSAVGIQSVYGMAAYQDTNNRIPGVQLIEAVRQIPGFSF